MKLIPLGTTKKAKKRGFAMVDDEDYDHLMQWRWHLFVNKYGGGSYARSFTKKDDGKYKNVWMHRVIMNLSDGEFVDHIDRNGLNNQKNNLRYCTDIQNRSNRNKIKNRSSVYIGVCLKKGRKKWIAGIKINKKSIHLGYYENEQDAALAYNKKALELFGQFANLNIIK